MILPVFTRTGEFIIALEVRRSQARDGAIGQIQVTDVAQDPPKDVPVMLACHEFKTKAGWKALCMEASNAADEQVLRRLAERDWEQVR